MNPLYSWLKSPGPFFILMLLGFFVFLFSVWGLMFEKTWMHYVFAAYAFLFVLCFIFLLSTFIKSKIKPVTIEEFEKSLKGGLYHFKCPSCQGIFAIKKSRCNDKKLVKMTCPDCGAMGIISPHPVRVEEVIPEKKSLKANFTCRQCGEGLTIWAEGTELYEHVLVCSCPYCGAGDNMVRI
ncbi:MAG: hypothetical protein JW771_07825 [Candidatus Thermoplasmatota archaeon]|nr:hypothetical protein [Candidatus Thermoplasmatota archaeon]